MEDWALQKLSNGHSEALMFGYTGISDDSNGRWNTQNHTMNAFKDR